jgi:3-hydroxybutyryl-CoA dehydrogenase
MQPDPMQPDPSSPQSLPEVTPAVLQGEYRCVGVVGAGQMGAGIAQVLAQAMTQDYSQDNLKDYPKDYHTVVLYDSQAHTLPTAQARIQNSLERLAAKQALAAGSSVASILKRIHFTPHVDDLAPCDVVIEAIIEQEGPKRRLFADLDALLAPHALLLSNTSSLSITRLATATQRPQQVMGMHFMNPVPVMPLVELVVGLHTSPHTQAVVTQLTYQLGKTPVLSRDMPGFISNRVLMPMINEAIYALHEGVGSAADIDAVMTLGMRHPMGPLRLADFIGLDTVQAILEVLASGIGPSRFQPCPLLTHYVDAGFLGKKAGRGFYNDYS